ncbi:MAG: MBL fold metallo-hydrolase [Halobacteriaceae archaeon]
MTVTRVSVPVDTRAPTGQTNAYVIGSEAAVLVDPGAVADSLDGALADRSVAHLVVTHTHPDHVGGVAAYAARTGATVWARAGRTDRFEAATGVTPDATFREGTVLDTDPPVTVMDLPGHTVDHVGFTVGEVTLVGDAAIDTGSVFVGADEGDMRAYYTTLRRLIVRDDDLVYPGHGDPITAPRQRLTALLAHRRDRERRVATAVQEGARSVEAVVAAAYEKDLSGVEDLARETVIAHLRKLAREGRVSWDGATARP